MKARSRLLWLPLVSALVLGGCRNEPEEGVIASSAPQRVLGGKPEKGKLPKGSVTEVRVVGVSDGDTIKVLTPERTEVRIRLNGIDSPESKMPFGTQAKKRLSDLVFGKTVTAQVNDVDRYGRSVAIVTIDGESVNQRMVSDGFAWWYRSYAKKDRELERLESEARRARRGLWADPRPVAPWEWRKSERERS